MTIGRWPEWSVTAARRRAQELRRAADVGQDPLEDKRLRRAEATLRDVAYAYLEGHASKKKTGERDREYLERDVLPRLGARRMSEIARRDVVELVEAKARAAPVAANRLLACLRKVFNWAIASDLADANPCLMVTAPAREVRRDRVLSLDEIRTVWTQLDTAGGVSASVRAILRLALISAQRPGEIAGMEWSEIDGDWWTIPSPKAKNGLSHRVPLTPLALAVLESLQTPSRWVFPSRGDRPIQVNALAHAVRRSEGFGVDRWTPHDLRRTAASHMTGNGVARLVVKRILNHAETDITAVYDRHSYDQEKRDALSKWSQILGSSLKERREVRP